MGNLFQTGDFQLHSGGHSRFKIDCDCLTDEDWQTIARMVAANVRFRDVTGIPEGGLKFAEALKPYADPLSDIHLIVDDVLTTGQSMDGMKRHLHAKGIRNIYGVVLFSRSLEYEPLGWIHPVFQLRLY